MARRGRFSSSLRPFGGLVSDLSAYQIGTSSSATTAPSYANTQSYVNNPWSDPTGPGAPAGSSWTTPTAESNGLWVYTPPPPPVKPTVAPEVGALPIIQVPYVNVPNMVYEPENRSEGR